MEIRDPVHGTLEILKDEIPILDSPVLQRLRFIRQVGFLEFAFPGGTHSRFLHSLGVFHLAGIAFDHIFRDFSFRTPADRSRLRQTTRLAALLHDVGHGPLSHTTEEVMPSLSELKIKAYLEDGRPQSGQATHEDYTLLLIMQSELSETIRRQFPDILPRAIAALVDVNLKCPADYFQQNGLDLRPVLGQIVSSELDCDRMDYLVRDSYFCGTSYGRIELNWLLGNLTYHEVDQRLNLAITRRSLYTFDNFLISRHHMYLIVYFHHKAIVYDEMLFRYLKSPDCTFKLPAESEKYLDATDPALYENLRNSKNPWARRVSERRPYQILFELHETKESSQISELDRRLNESGIQTIRSNSVARLSKYHNSLSTGNSPRIYVVDSSHGVYPPYPLEESTDIFQLYEKSRMIDRIYVAPEDFEKASAQIRF